MSNKFPHFNLVSLVSFKYLAQFLHLTIVVKATRSTLKQGCKSFSCHVLHYRHFLPNSNVADYQDLAFPQCGLFYRTARSAAPLPLLLPFFHPRVGRFPGRLVNKNSSPLRSGTRCEISEATLVCRAQTRAREVGRRHESVVQVCEAAAGLELLLLPHCRNQVYQNQVDHCAAS